MSASGIPTLLTDAVVSRLDYINKEIIGIDKDGDSNVFIKLKGHSRPDCRISCTYEVGDTQQKIDRFSNNLPPVATMLKINGYFFNANHVELISGHPFIATQAPHCHMESGLLREELFWRTLLEYHIPAVFNLTSPEEICDDYIHNDERFGCRAGATGINFDIRLKSLEETQDAYLSTNHILSSHSGGDFSPHEFIYIKAQDWRDFKSISLNKLEALVDKVEKMRVLFSSTPLVVHCRAGVGRTGTLIVACAIKALVQNGEINDRNFKSYIAGLVLSLRDQRGPECVQREEQLTMLFDYAKKLLVAEKDQGQELG